MEEREATVIALTVRRDTATVYGTERSECRKLFEFASAGAWRHKLGMTDKGVQ
jgi:hypothetical protein